MRTASAPSGLKTMLVIILPLSFAAGIMVAGIGTLLWPPVSAWAAPLVCAGNVEVLSDHYSTPSGGSGVQRHITCVSAGAANADAAREDVTFMAIGIAGLVYAALAFVLLQLFAAPRIRRRAAARASPAGFDGGFGGDVRVEGVSSPAELQAILAQVADALRHGQAEVNVGSVTIEADEGDEVARRLARLQELRETGLIGDADYEAKKTEIMARL